MLTALWGKPKCVYKQVIKVEVEWRVIGIYIYGEKCIDKPALIALA